MIHLGRSDLSVMARKLFKVPIALRDAGALEGALARPRNVSSFGERSLFVVASYYADGIIRSHPFVDGNKRMAWAATAMFLGLNNLSPHLAGDARIADIVVSLADGTTTREYFAGFLDASSLPRQVVA